MIPTNELEARERVVLRKSLAIARDAFASNRIEMPGTSRRFRAETRYDDRTHHLSVSVLNPRSDHGTVTACSDSKRFRLEIQPFNERASTPLVTIEARRPRNEIAPGPGRDSIVGQIDRMMEWTNAPADPGRKERRASLAVALGAHLHAEGYTHDVIGVPMIWLGTPWEQGLVGIPEGKMPIRTFEQERALRSFCDRHRDVVEAVIGDDPTCTMEATYVDASNRTRMSFDLTTRVRFRARPMDAMEAMRRMG